MNQQINLFQPIFRKERKILSFVTMVQICLIVLAALLLISGYSWWQTLSLKQNLAGLKQQHQARLAQLDKVTREVAKMKDKDQSQSQIERLEQELQAERHILAVLDGKRLRQIKGFSSYFESFSHQVVQGMWLTGFDVANGGQSVQIRGSSTEPDLVPRFLQGLSKEKQLQGTEFSVLQMLREDDDVSWVDFVVSAGKDTSLISIDSTK
jgi:Tfp pilus assembly protein PilN